MPTRRQLLTALAGTALLGACSRENPDDFTVSLDPVWEQPAQMFSMTATLTSDTLLLAGTEVDATRIVGHDLATGAVRWLVGDDSSVAVPKLGDVEIQTLGKRAEQSLLNRRNFVAGPVLPLSFWNDRGAGPSGVVGLDPASGTPVWGRTLVAEQSDLRLGTVVMAATESVVLAVTRPITTVTRPDFGQELFASGPTTTHALDAATGEVLWSVADVLVVWADQDTALAFRTSSDTMSGPSSVICGLDLAAGEPRWTGPDPVSLAAVAGDHALFHGADSADDGLLVRVSTGEVVPVPNVGRARPHLLAGEPPTLAWGTYDGSQTVTTQVVGEPDQVSGTKPSRFDTTRIARDLLWGVLPSWSNPTTVAFDRTGHQRSARIDSGVPIHVTEDWLIFVRTGFEVPTSYVVVPHRVTARG